MVRQWGAVSVKYSAQTLRPQAEGVTLFNALVPVEYPDHRKVTPQAVFYAIDSLFQFVRRRQSGAEVSSGAQKSLVAAKDNHACHKMDICIWYLASQHGIKNLQGKVFSCKDTTSVHVSLKTLHWQTVRTLVTQDAEFMGVCDSESVRQSVVQAVQANKQAFK